MDYIERIKYYTKKLKITEKKMLDDLGYSKNLILSWRKGSEPSINKLMSIAKYLNIDFAYLITGEEKYNLKEEDKKVIELLNEIDENEKIKEIARLELLIEQKKEKERENINKNKLSV